MPTTADYNVHRWYESGTGRYISPDPIPIGTRSEVNPFVYARGNPVRLKDALGLFCTGDFVNHYFTGGGRPIDLGAVGLLTNLQQSVDVRAAVFAFRSQSQPRAQGFAGRLCSGRNCGSQSGMFSFGGQYDIDLTNEPCLFSVGNSRLGATGLCSVNADCSNRNYSFCCGLGFGTTDYFIDALDIFDWFPGNQDVPGASPFIIHGHWSEAICGSGRF